MSEYNEPWIFDPSNGHVKDSDGDDPLIFDRLIERASACVNFCAGVSNEDLAKSNLKTLIYSAPETKPPPANPRYHLPPALLEALREYVDAKANDDSGCPFDHHWSAVEKANEVNP